MVAKINEIVRYVDIVLMKIVLVINIVKKFGCFRYSS